MLHLISLEQIHRNLYLFLLQACYLRCSKYVMTLRLVVRLTEFNTWPLLWFSIKVSLQVILRLTFYAFYVKANGTIHVTHFTMLQKKTQFLISSVH